MTDHLDEAAAKAVDIANRLREAAVNGMTPLGWEACAHLAYMAGLLRGGVREVGPCEGRLPALLAGARSEWCRLRSGHAGRHEGEDGATWTEDGFDVSIEQERDRLRAQRDELLAAARKALAEQTPTAELDLDEVVTRIEQER